MADTAKDESLETTQTGDRSQGDADPEIAAEDVAHWIGVYSELVSFLDGLIEERSAFPEVAQLVERRDEYRRRLDSWADRVGRRGS